MAKHPASFINAIVEEGTKADAIRWLQKTWDELCDLNAEYALLCGDRHPGYVIGSHWLSTAYSRICAGESEEDVMRDYGWKRDD
jgi:hypothetical protein